MHWLHELTEQIMALTGFNASYPGYPPGDTISFWLEPIDIEERMIIDGGQRAYSVRLNLRLPPAIGGDPIITLERVFDSVHEALEKIRTSGWALYLNIVDSDFAAPAVTFTIVLSEDRYTEEGG